MSCPINLECLNNRCPNADYCANLAAPWPLPYQIWEIDYWYDPGALVVSIPDFTNWEEVPNTDHDIEWADAYDSWVRYIRRELREAGWQNSVDLPYFWDEVLQALIVAMPLIFQEECRKQHPAEGFAPAIKLDNWRSNWLEQRRALNQRLRPPETDQWGFYLPNGVPGLAWKWQEED